MKVYSEMATILTSFIGIYYVFQTLWELAEELQFGEYVVSVADTIACILLSLITLAFITVVRINEK